MLNFDEDRFRRIQTGALSQGSKITQVIDQLLASGASNIFLMGTGGAAILMQPAALLLQRYSTFPVYTDHSAELMASGHASLGPKSIVVIPSVSGTTKESVALLDYCKNRGATVLSLVGHADSPLGKNADHAFVNFAEDDTSSESFYLQSLKLVLAILAQRKEIDSADKVLSDLSGLPDLLIEVKRAFEPEAERLAEKIKDEPYHIISGAGICWPQAWYYGMCILEEMQWIRTRPVHAADFFHGTLELVEKGVSVIVLKGEDASRPLADRVENFARQFTDRLVTIDTSSFALPGISAETRALISPIILATVLERLSAHLEIKRNHPLTTRRYYKRVAY